MHTVAHLEVSTTIIVRMHHLVHSTVSHILLQNVLVGTDYKLCDRKQNSKKMQNMNEEVGKNEQEKELSQYTGCSATHLVHCLTYSSPQPSLLFSPFPFFSFFHFSYLCTITCIKVSTEILFTRFTLDEV